MSEQTIHSPEVPARLCTYTARLEQEYPAPRDWVREWTARIAERRATQ